MITEYPLAHYDARFMRWLDKRAARAAAQHPEQLRAERPRAAAPGLIARIRAVLESEFPARPGALGHSG